MMDEELGALIEDKDINNKLDRIECNEITDSLELPDSDVILMWISEGWERV